MPKITILEEDQTQVVGSLSTTDVVYVPGFADTNSNYYIFSGASVPGTNTPGTVPMTDSGDYIFPNTDNINNHIDIDNGIYPNYACNVLQKKSWYCKNANTSSEPKQYTWEECAYVAPYPENTPILCNSVQQFEQYFAAGKQRLPLRQAQQRQSPESYPTPYRCGLFPAQYWGRFRRVPYPRELSRFQWEIPYILFQQVLPWRLALILLCFHAHFPSEMSDPRPRRSQQSEATPMQ